MSEERKTTFATRNPWAAQFEGMVAGFESYLRSIKKLLCCPPMAEDVEYNSELAVKGLKAPLEALREAAVQLEFDAKR